MKNEFVTSLKHLLKTPKQCVIFPHKNPDGDALGSTLALYHFLRAKGHDVVIISPNEYPKFLQWMPGQENILLFNKEQSRCLDLIQKAEVIFTLDFNALSRISPINDFLVDHKATFVMIDHHQSPENYTPLTYSDASIGSTCEMVYSVLHTWDASIIDTAIAECLYTGIMTDSGSFRFPSTSSTTHRIVADLIDRGVAHAKIHQNIFDSARFERLQLLGRTLQHLKTVNPLPAVYTYLRQNDLDAFDYQKGDTEGFVNYGLSLEGIQLAVILIENTQEQIIKMSFRSKGSFDVNQFARKYFNGGGHKNAAGGKSDESMENTMVKLEKAIRDCTQDFK